MDRGTAGEDEVLPLILDEIKWPAKNGGFWLDEYGAAFWGGYWLFLAAGFAAAEGWNLTRHFSATLVHNDVVSKIFTAHRTAVIEAGKMNQSIYENKI